MKKEIAQLAELDRQRTLLVHLSAILGWDQETFMPEKAIDERSEQLSLIEGLAHERSVMPEIGELLARVEGFSGLDAYEKAFVRVLKREYDRETKLPLALVTDFAKEVSVSQASWAQARENNDYASFAPHLRKIIELNKEKAACLNPTAKPYDVLLDLYEPGSTEVSISEIFGIMKRDLEAIMCTLAARPRIDDSFLHKKVSAAAQAKISAYLMDALGYDRTRGRLDLAPHPFTTTLGRMDVRITTRYLEDFLPSGMFSTIHETGHALYEMGIDPHPEYRGTQLADAASMAIHESQSRMWENIIGRSAAFWEKHYRPVAEMAEGALDGVSLEKFVSGINKVEPSLIRTEADEVTYGLHIIARFELESDLISGNLTVEDLPEAWNAKIHELLGLEVPNFKKGCLQDIHWSMGSFGYFPSYALGNLYAAQFWATMEKDIPELEDSIKSGMLQVPLSWLRAHVHSYGAMFTPSELVQRATGEALNPAYFSRYLAKKFFAE
jgi:carboxypeptidase Taq